MGNVTVTNLTFKGAEPTWANACVGANGNPQIIEYANGFATAANLLIDQVIRDESKTIFVDELIYPICFNMRHALELHLKAAIENITIVSRLRGRSLPEFPAASTHDLGNIWQYLKANAEVLDKRYSVYLTRLEEFVNDIAVVDSTGQVFRYPFDTENIKHLVDVSIINVIVLQRRFNKLETLLSEFNSLNVFLIDEYACGSFTTKLSRPELFDIALRLPKRNQWGTAEFDIAKAALRDEYGLSSNDYCKALNIIQAHYEMSQHIDVVVPLFAVSLPMLDAFFTQWVILHGIDEDGGLAAASPEDLGNELEFVLRENSRSRSALEQWWGANVELFSASNVAELEALYYFPTGLHYSEYFVLARETFIKRMSVNGPNGVKDGIFHLLRKTSAIGEVLSTLRFLGQSSLVQSLVEKHGLQEAHIRDLGMPRLR